MFDLFDFYVSLFVGILNSCGGDAVLLAWVKEKLWQYEVHAVMLSALKQDFNKILDGWNTAAKLARILVYVYYVTIVSIIETKNLSFFLQGFYVR